MLKKRFGLAGRESGQGTLEYILVLVIVVIIILSLLYRFHGAFRTYAQAFFDGYVACLLETGELPGTGATCESEMPQFNSKNAKMLLKDNLPNGGGGTTGGGGKNDKKSAGDNNHRGETKGGGGGGGGGSVARLRDSGRNRTSEVGKVSDAGESSFGGSDQSGVARTMASGHVNATSRPRDSKMEVMPDGKVQEKPPAERPKTASITKKLDESNEMRPVKSVENATRKAASSEEEDKGFSIGAFVRLLIIILIIVAMVIFFGGQLIQIFKSRDKGGGG